MSLFPGVQTLSINGLAIRGYAVDGQTAGGHGKLQRTIASFWSGSAATDSLDDSLVGRTRSCEASMDEVSTLATDTVHVEGGNISSVDEGANEPSILCPNGSSSNRRKAGNSRAFKDDWELEYLVVEDKDRQCSEFLSVFKVHNIKRHIDRKQPFIWRTVHLLWAELTLVRGKPLVVQGLWSLYTALG